MLLIIEKILISKSDPIFCSVQTTEDRTLRRLHRKSLHDLMSGNKEMTRRIVRVLCGYTRKNLVLAKN